jgi:glyoxylase I family protein
VSLSVEKFSHVCIGVSDMDRSLAFYTDIFGKDIVFDVELEGEALEIVTGSTGAKGRMVGLDLGGTAIELLALGADPSSAPVDGIRVGFTNISVSVPDLDEAYRHVCELGYTPDQEPVDIGGVRMFFVRDPDDARVEIIEFPGDARTTLELWRGRADA